MRLVLRNLTHKRDSNPFTKFVRYMFDPTSEIFTYINRLGGIMMDYDDLKNTMHRTKLLFSIYSEVESALAIYEEVRDYDISRNDIKIMTINFVRDSRFSNNIRFVDVDVITYKEVI